MGCVLCSLDESSEFANSMRKTIEYLILKELFFLTMNVTDSIVRNRQNQRNNLVIGFENIICGESLWHSPQIL